MAEKAESSAHALQSKCRRAGRTRLEREASWTAPVLWRLGNACPKAAAGRRTRVPGRGLVYRDERFPTGVGDANRSRTARSFPRGGGAKGRAANARPKEHKWAGRQAVGGEGAGKHEARSSPTPPLLWSPAARAERTDPDPGRVPRPRGRGQSAGAVVAFEERTNPKTLRAKGRRTKEQNSMRT